jgi:DNA-directed RNA polymerase subunit beta
LGHDAPEMAARGRASQRRALPLLRPEAPLVGTGMEAAAAAGSRAAEMASRGGVVTQAGPSLVVVSPAWQGQEEGGPRGHRLAAFGRGGSLLRGQRPAVRVGGLVRRGQALACGPGAKRARGVFAMVGAQ